jgi:hypothetical protein
MKLKVNDEAYVVPKTTIERVVNINTWFRKENKRESEARKHGKNNTSK